MVNFNCASVSDQVIQQANTSLKQPETLQGLSTNLEKVAIKSVCGSQSPVVMAQNSLPPSQTNAGLQFSAVQSNFALNANSSGAQVEKFLQTAEPETIVIRRSSSKPNCIAIDSKEENGSCSHYLALRTVEGKWNFGGEKIFNSLNDFFVNHNLKNPVNILNLLPELSLPSGSDLIEENITLTRVIDRKKVEAFLKAKEQEERTVVIYQSEEQFSQLDKNMRYHITFSYINNKESGECEHVVVEQDPHDKWVVKEAVQGFIKKKFDSFKHIFDQLKLEKFVNLLPELSLGYMIRLSNLVNNYSLLKDEKEVTLRLGTIKWKVEKDETEEDEIMYYHPFVKDGKSEDWSADQITKVVFQQVHFSNGVSGIITYFPNVSQVVFCHAAFKILNEEGDIDLRGEESVKFGSFMKQLLKFVTESKSDTLTLVFKECLARNSIKNEKVPNQPLTFELFEKYPEFKQVMKKAKIIIE